MRRPFGPLLVAAAALATGGLAAASLPIGDSGAVRKQNGLHGTVYRGPIRPVCTQTEPCEAPAPGVTLIFTHAGVRVARTMTGADGSYRVLLPAAIYTVATGVRGPGPGRETAPYPRRVKVRPGHIDKLDFRIDTGIR
jgi:hypothetical protein